MLLSFRFKTVPWVYHLFSTEKKLGLVFESIYLCYLQSLAKIAGDLGM